MAIEHFDGDKMTKLVEKHKNKNLIEKLLKNLFLTNLKCPENLN